MAAAFAHRGIALTLIASGPFAFAAQAGGRSLVTVGQTRSETMARARQAIDDGYSFAPDRLGLWFNDTTHWLAHQRAAHPEIEIVAETGPRHAPGWTIRRGRDVLGFGFLTETEAWVAALAMKVPA
jgi:hypothetical protein